MSTRLDGELKYHPDGAIFHPPGRATQSQGAVDGDNSNSTRRMNPPPPPDASPSQQRARTKAPAKAQPSKRDPNAHPYVRAPSQERLDHLQRIRSLPRKPRMTKAQREAQIWEQASQSIQAALGSPEPTVKPSIPTKTRKRGRAAEDEALEVAKAAALVAADRARLGKPAPDLSGVRLAKQPPAEGTDYSLRGYRAPPFTDDGQDSEAESDGNGETPSEQADQSDDEPIHRPPRRVREEPRRTRYSDNSRVSADSDSSWTTAPVQSRRRDTSASETAAIAASAATAAALAAVDNHERYRPRASRAAQEGRGRLSGSEMMAAIRERKARDMEMMTRARESDASSNSRAYPEQRPLTHQPPPPQQPRIRVIYG